VTEGYPTHVKVGLHDCRLR